MTASICDGRGVSPLTLSLSMAVPAQRYCNGPVDWGIVMPNSFMHVIWPLCLVALSLPAMATAGSSQPVSHATVSASRPARLTSSPSGAMRVGLTLVAPDAQPAATPPAPASLDYPASPNALLCRSEKQGYRECRTPFRGRAMLAREADGIRCIQDANWGWRDGAVWVDRGCAAVFVQESAALGESPAA